MRAFHLTDDEIALIVTFRALAADHARMVASLMHSLDAEQSQQESSKVLSLAIVKTA